MPSRLALLGSKEGAWVDMSRLARPLIRITGLPHGSTVTMLVMCDGIPTEYKFADNGEHRIERGTWAKVGCDIPAKTLVCTLDNFKAA